MPATTSRSPSPVSAPPLANAPGPRAAALQKLYADAISHTLKTCSYNNFASCFPTPARHAPDAMKDLHHDFIEKLDRLCKDNFEVILRDRDVVSSLNSLDRLVEEARKRRAKAVEEAGAQPVQAPTPPHTLPPSDLYHAHLNPSLVERQDALSDRLQSIQNENATLLQTLLQQRREIEGLVSGVEAIVADVDACNQALPHADLLALNEQTVQLDTEMRVNS